MVPDPATEIAACRSSANHRSFTESAIFITVVKQKQMVKPDDSLGAEVLRILRAIPGLTLTAEHSGTDRGVDAILEFAGSEAPVTLQVKHRASAATAWQLVHEADARPDTSILLVTDESTASARQILQEHGIAVVDGLGNAHIELPGLLIHLEGRQSRRQTRPARLSGKAGVVAQALLLYPERRWHVQELAEEAGVSLGLAHRVLARLVVDGLVAEAGAGSSSRSGGIPSSSALTVVTASELLNS